jgi:hypothetical protein
MKLWTIQDLEVWEKLERRGRLRCSISKADKCDLPPYRWMASQMKKRIGPPYQPNALPLWAWYQWYGIARRRPDLRAGGLMTQGEWGVRIEIEVPDESVLLSDYELWHYVLNYWYLPSSLAEGEEFDDHLEKLGFQSALPKDWQSGRFFRTTLPPKYHRKIVSSWNRVFDLSCKNPDYTSSRDMKIIQATFWVLTLDQVRKVKHFKAR